MSGKITIPESEALIRSQASHTMLELFDSLYEGALAVDRDGRIVWMNDKYKALLGWNGVEPIEGRLIEEIIPESSMRDIVESGRATLLDIMVINDRPLVVSRIPLKNDDGDVVGAMGFILYDRLQSLKPLVSKFSRLHSELASAHRELAQERRAKYNFSQFAGTSGQVRELKHQARRAAERDLTVLLLGETGTGKELLAHAIHAASPRADKPMVRVNAAAIPETLLEAELFGTAAGAYTGADRRGREGKFMVADGGTLFLDEVGDIPLAVQAKLLRVLQEGEVEPLGANKVIDVDVRIIAATSRDLKAMVEAGDFRSDLFYRLNVLPLAVPPLRDRLEDIGILCEVLLDQIAVRSGGPQAEISQGAIEFLCRHDWPGNVRELRNILEQVVAMRDIEFLTAEHLVELLPDLPARDTTAAANGGEVGTVRPLREAVQDAERTAIELALGASGGVKVHAAKMLGISRAQLYEKLENLGIVSRNPDKRKTV